MCMIPATAMNAGDAQLMVELGQGAERLKSSVK
jgi:hypothetical protein